VYLFLSAVKTLGISFITSVISIMGGRMKFISKSDVFIAFS
jgi:hypothetical protein